MMMTKYTALAALALIAAQAMPCSAQTAPLFTRLNDAVKYRQSAFQVMSTHMQRISAMAKGNAPFDKPTAETNAAIIELLSRQLIAAFPPGSDMAPSRTKPEAWQDAAQFKAKGEQLQSAASVLSNAAKSNDIAAFKTAFNAMTQTCKACHDGYRNR